MDAAIQRKPGTDLRDTEDAAWTEGIIEYLKLADQSGCFLVNFPRAFGEIPNGEEADATTDPLIIEVMIDDPDFVFSKRVDLGEMVMDICSDDFSDQASRLSKVYAQKLREIADKIDPRN